MQGEWLRGRVNNPEYGNNVWMQESKLESIKPNSAQHKFLFCLLSVTYEELFKITVVLCFDNA
jgi:hypothetical protein